MDLSALFSKINCVNNLFMPYEVFISKENLLIGQKKYWITIIKMYIMNISVITV